MSPESPAALGRAGVLSEGLCFRTKPPKGSINNCSAQERGSWSEQAACSAVLVKM